MFEVLSNYWPHVLAALSVLMGGVAAIHAAMTKRDVRSAIGWVGIIILSPIVGALIYTVAGINRIRRASKMLRRARHPGLWKVLSQYVVATGEIEAQFGRRFAALKVLGDRVAGHSLTSGNRIEILASGDETYDAFAKAINAARHSVLLETYIFDRDAAGLRIADCLVAAHRRGVEVRVLIDAVGARYSVPSIVGYLRERGVTTASFNGQVILGLRLPYANLRTHRKILVVDGETAFMGGMNIRAGFTGPDRLHDTHFRLSGPVVADVQAVAAEDWAFETGETLTGEAWAVSVDCEEPGTKPYMRAVVSGPDTNLETNHKTLMGAFSVAETSIRIMSPYFLPDNILLGALATAARRGVTVDILVPANNNLAIVSHAMTAQFEQILRDGCRIHRVQGPFDHSKLATVDGQWSFVGSSNLDSRSLRLNFEVDVEVYDPAFAEAVDARIRHALEHAEAVDLDTLRQRPFLVRLFDRVVWLASPYL
ncbi:cardiolipin synthase [Rhizobium sp. RU36D]|uniref:cardiolipin synthase n=1 Tax=Rhizobium sp. RU36D TaxID=1907415 RepID=UPI0009D844FC|nr:cardiolipin synthase [Rhizobium sp. RU36D]SMC59107.1 cardiolipin synthase [Rhizobium sp. RU36D]